MKRSIVVLLVSAIALTLAAVPASAGPPTPASGTWDYALTGPPEVRVTGPNMFIYGQDRGEWGGTLDGYTEEEFVIVCHPNAGFSFYQGEMTFYGTVADESGVEHEGTMVLKANGKQYSDTCEPNLSEWQGHWVIIGGTEDLSNVQGQGTFYGPTFHLLYEGQIDFS